MRFTRRDGEFEFKGEYRVPRAEDWILTNNGAVLQMLSVDEGWNDGVWADDVRAIIHPVLVEYEFGGVRFRGTGERRIPCKDEWFLCDGGPRFAASDIKMCLYPILVAI